MEFICIKSFQASNGKEYTQGVVISLAEYNNLPYKESCNFENKSHIDTVRESSKEETPTSISMPIVDIEYNNMSDNGHESTNDSGSIDFGNGGDFGGGGSTDSY